MKLKLNYNGKNLEIQFTNRLFISEILYDFFILNTSLNFN